MAEVAKLQTPFDSLILIDSDKLLDVSGDPRTMDELFTAMNDLFRETVSGMTEMINIQGLVGVDFEDVRTVMGNMGPAMTGVATAAGVDRAFIAADEAIASPLLEGIDLAAVRGMLVSITAKQGMKMKEINDVMNTVRASLSEDALTVFGTSYDENMQDDLRVALIATGVPDRVG